METGKPFVIAKIETPELRISQVLLTIAYSGACGTQQKEVAGDKDEEIKKIAGNGVDPSVEETGIPAVMKQATTSTRRKDDRAVVIGNSKSGSTVEFSLEIFNSGRSLLGAWRDKSKQNENNTRFSSLLASGRFPVRELLSKPHLLEKINKTLDEMRSDKIDRPLIDMSL